MKYQKFTKFLNVIYAAGILFTGAVCAQADVSPEAAALAKKSEAYCAETAKTQPIATPQMVMEKVRKAAALLEGEGSKAFPKFNGRKSEFIFSGTYIWIHTLDKTLVLVHPIKPGMIGESMIGIKDPNGKRFVAELNQSVQKTGEGWVDYVWPKPGETTPSIKTSFGKKAMCDGQEVVVACGIYNATRADVLKALGQTEKQ